MLIFLQEAFNLLQAFNHRQVAAAASHPEEVLLAASLRDDNQAIATAHQLRSVTPRSTVCPEEKFLVDTQLMVIKRQMSRRCSTRTEDILLYGQEDN
jgi:hypothetical protein